MQPRCQRYRGAYDVDLALRQAVAYSGVALLAPLQVLADRYSVSAERIRQLEKSALGKLKQLLIPDDRVD